MAPAGGDFCRPIESPFDSLNGALPVPQPAAWELASRSAAALSPTRAATFPLFRALSRVTPRLRLTGKVLPIHECASLILSCIIKGHKKKKKTVGEQLTRLPR